MKVVCLVNSTEIALNAFKFYLNYCHKEANEIHLYHAVIPLNENGSDQVIQFMEEEKDRANELSKQIDKIIKNFTKQNQMFLNIVKHWDPVKRFGQIADHAINYSNSINAGMIVTGSRNLSGMKKVLIGSVSSAILKKSVCPVVVHKT